MEIMSTSWIISANEKFFNHKKAFDEKGFIDWGLKGEFKTGDIIYIYMAKPIQRIKFKTKVEKINMLFEDIIDNEEYWYDKGSHEKSKSNKFFRLYLIEEVHTERLTYNSIKENGFNLNYQARTKVTEELQNYIEKSLTKSSLDINYPDEIDEILKEGHGQKSTVNKYERNLKARNKCLAEYGYSCVVCNMNFEDVYGDIGRTYIHVHHIVPLSEIKKDYTVNPKTDLIPVCPNCHSMLHKKINNEYLSIKELKDIYEVRNQTL